MFWADELAKIIIEEKGNDLCVATGITPSGPIHLGNLKEVMVGFLVAEALKKKKAKVRFILLIDDYDPLRKVYPFLPKEYGKYIGHPLSEIPDPEGCHQNYAEHFLADFYNALEILNVHPEILSAKKLYQTGVYDESIKLISENQAKIIEILQEVSGRKIEKDWSPYNEKTKKLSYRLQWPSTWKIFHVSIEGFGKDHATRGGTYDSASRIAREIFKIEPPFPIPYEWVYVKGQGKMAGSTGVGFTPLEMLEVMPPKALIHFYKRSKPNRHIDFDISENLSGLWQESGGLTGIPFEHLVTVTQSATDFESIIESLKRTGYKDQIQNREALKEEVKCVKNWLARYAPERLKFQIQENLPETAKSLNPAQKEFLKKISDIIKSSNLAGEELHQKIHEIKKEMAISPREAFSAIYLVFLGKDSGPQAGWLLASLDKDFVLKRLEEAQNA